MNKKILAFGIVGMLLMAGCASQAIPAPTAMMEASTATPEAMMASSSATPETMMASGSATPEAMMATAIPGTGAMMTGTTSTPEAMLATGTPGGMMMENEWLAASLTNINTGKSFKLSDFSGKTVLLELITTNHRPV